jgi:hypothetical protein
MEMGIGQGLRSDVFVINEAKTSERLPPTDITQSADMCYKILVGLKWLHCNLNENEWADFCAARMKGEVGKI